MSESNHHNQISPLSKHNEEQKADFFIIATPIGDLSDITLRALEMLKTVDLIICEDTRVTAKLLSAYAIGTRTTYYNDFSSQKDRDKIINLLEQGKKIALVSDAGTPLICDPGYKLIKDIKEKGFLVTSAPGASSVINALTICTLPTNRFLFEGFLPAKKEARCKILDDLKNLDATLVFFESAKRLIFSLNDIQHVLGDREISVLREMTKRYEEVKSGKISEIIDYYTENPPRGEIVITVSGKSASSDGSASEDEIKEQIKNALKHMRLKDAVSLVSENLSLRKKEVYNIALRISKDE